ncbi:MAG: amino acid adenylation domain-containing protein [Gammaproteobacteria bacterium]
MSTTAESLAVNRASGFLHEQFEYWAEHTPDAVALRVAACEYSYAELNHCANRVAYFRRAQGVGPDVLVGVCLAPSVELISCLLGVLKAGGAYLPFDPAYPADRLRDQFEQAHPVLVLGDDNTVAKLAAVATDLISYAAILDATEGLADESLPSHSSADDICYLMFTSGSTGRPNGVMVTHANVADLFTPITPILELRQNDVWSWYHSAAFGYSMWEIWGAFVHGATLLIVPEECKSDPRILLKCLQENEVSILSLTPSAFRQMLLLDVALAPEQLRALRLIAFSGEPVVVEDLNAWYARHGDAGPSLVSTYSITETAGRVTLRVYDRSTCRKPGIGKPLDDTDVYLLDDALQPVPDGEVGDMYVAGPGVARGYLNQPELTAERFPSLPLNGGDPVRVFASRDRARRRKNGELEFLGRDDRQIKLRGHRIELDEIEHGLRAHAAVAEAAVAAEQTPDGQRLRAWVVPADTEGDDRPEFWPSLGHYQIYDELLYELMDSDPVRLDAYRSAFEQQVRDKIVLDIGTGQDALLARMCVAAGACRVYAVEVLEDAAQRARALVERLGLQETIIVLHGDMRSLDLPEPVDVCTQGIIGNIGSADGIVPIWTSARAFFAADCIAIPRRCVTYIAPVELPSELIERPRFSRIAGHYAQKIFAEQGAPFDVRLCVRNVPAEALLSTPQVFETLDFTTALATDETGQGSFVLTRDGRCDGFMLWTAVETMPGEQVDFFANQQAWLPVFFPLSDAGERLLTGDEITAHWSRSTAGESIFPDYAIEASVGGRSLSYTSHHHETACGATQIHRALLQSVEDTPAQLSVPKLREWLGQRLPDYMVPTAWELLPSLPLNANGKLDRAALPAYLADKELDTANFVAPETALECALNDIWGELLDRQDIGVHADFFAVGGDSMLAVRLITDIQRLLDDTIFLAALFDGPSIAELAHYLEEHHAAAVAHWLASGTDAVETGEL